MDQDAAQEKQSEISLSIADSKNTSIHNSCDEEHEVEKS